MLSNNILQLLNTAPTINDPEDDTHELTQAKVVEKPDDEEGDSAEPSSIRKRTVGFLDEEDVRYTGKKASRKRFAEDFDVQSDQDDFENDDGSDNDDFENDDDDEEMSGDDKNQSENSEFSGDEENELDKVELQDEDDGFQTISNETSDVSKGQCVKNQLLLWEKLLEMRIQLQKCVFNANKLPQKDYFSQLKETGEDFQTRAGVVEDSVKSLLDKLLELQGTLIKAYPETSKLDGKKRKVEEEEKEELDEEIPSDTESEKSKEEEQNEEKNSTPAKKMKLDDYETTIFTKYDSYKNYRNQVVRKWHDKTCISVAKYMSNSNSVINQIEYLLKDREKTVKRTQVNRTNIEIIGKNQKPEIVTAKSEESTDKEEKFPLDPEIFDDTDFYHQLLRELIEHKTRDVTDPIKLGQQWVKLQSLRSKIKRAIDTRATKGRKLKYVVHNKMVNFMAPVDRSTWTEESKAELFKSLFKNAM